MPKGRILQETPEGFADERKIDPSNGAPGSISRGATQVANRDHPEKVRRKSVERHLSIFSRSRNCSRPRFGNKTFTHPIKLDPVLLKLTSVDASKKRE